MKRNRKRQRAKLRATPGLNGDYSGTCVGCMKPTDTGLLVEGEAEFLTALLMKLGVQDEVASAMVGDLAVRAYGCDRGNVPTADMRADFRTCGGCAAKVGMTATLIVGGGNRALYRQPESMREA